MNLCLIIMLAQQALSVHLLRLQHFQSSLPFILSLLPVVCAISHYHPEVFLSYQSAIYYIV